MKEGEIIFKEYVESTKQFHFGPLLCGKSREWYVLPAGCCTFLDTLGDMDTIQGSPWQSPGTHLGLKEHRCVNLSIQEANEPWGSRSACLLGALARAPGCCQSRGDLGQLLSASTSQLHPLGNVWWFLKCFELGS